MGRRRSALLWGVVGALSFLVLTTGYRLLVAGLPLGAVGTGLGALAVGATVAGATLAAEDRLTHKGRT